MSHLGTGDKTEGDRNNILHNIELITLGNMASRGDQGCVRRKSERRTDRESVLAPDSHEKVVFCVRVNVPRW